MKRYWSPLFALIAIAAMVGSAAYEPRGPLDLPVTLRTVTFLVDDYTDVGYACDMASLSYDDSQRATIHAVNCTSDRLFVEGFDR